MLDASRCARPPGGGVEQARGIQKFGDAMELTKKQYIAFQKNTMGEEHEDAEAKWLVAVHDPSVEKKNLGTDYVTVVVLDIPRIRAVNSRLDKSNIAGKPTALMDASDMNNAVSRIVGADVPSALASGQFSDMGGHHFSRSGILNSDTHRSMDVSTLIEDVAGGLKMVSNNSENTGQSETVAAASDDDADTRQASLHMEATCRCYVISTRYGCIYGCSYGVDML